MNEYCNILKALREERYLSQKEVANYLGTTQQVYSRYETGVNEIPVRQLIKLCELYNVSADYILGIK